ncbi:DUF882 domain-containing protein [Epibacterium sp. SM1979]|uniref:Murein endopeptidase K n=1 Tax=Tritonibacter litoralis TaxID=2662264 RepID=A0A843YIY8_9RHOB|nr:D-Ala-D-Ala carboxypeptidase family metallohydrolase [Tritonibacter litoralis]MQQ09119.1 DUF882 domain-containing protein [Tritonibacter litoralis]
MIFFKHWSHVPADLWRWPNFSPEEIACRGTSKVGIDFDAMEKLQALRNRLGTPIILNSAYRSPEHNSAVGGATRSQHLKAKAFDVSMANHDPEQFELAARAVGFTGFGFYKRNNFIHIDTGPDREWGDRWKSPKTTTLPPPRFSPPPAPVPERPRDDIDLKGLGAGAIGGVATVGPVLSGIGNLTPVAQVVAVLGALLLVAGLAVMARRKLREWA